MTNTDKGTRGINIEEVIFKIKFNLIIFKRYNMGQLLQNQYIEN